MLFNCYVYRVGRGPIIHHEAHEGHEDFERYYPNFVLFVCFVVRFSSQ